MKKIKTFDLQWKQQAQPFLQQAFDGFIPRSEFLKKSEKTNSNQLLCLLNEKPNILEVKTDLAPYSNKLINFDEVFATCLHYGDIRETMDSIIHKVSLEVESVSAVFVTFSTDITGSNSGIKHLHPLMNTDRCNVWTFGIPLYIGEHAPTFEISMCDHTWNTRYYLDYKRIKDANLDYMSIALPKDGSIFNIQFDGSRHPHVITYTDSIYMWLVFDGIKFKDNRDNRTQLTIGYV